MLLDALAMTDRITHYRKSYIFGIGGVCGAATTPALTFEPDKVTCPLCREWLGKPPQTEVAPVPLARVLNTRRFP